MLLGLETTLADAASHSLSDRQVRSLARTFDRIGAPVWVEDPGGIRLYANAAAGTDAVSEPTFLSMEILDHTGRIVGRLNTACG
jgi:hypothetical protein